MKNELMNTANGNNGNQRQYVSEKKDNSAGKLLLAIFGVLFLVVIVVAVVLIAKNAKGKFGNKAPADDINIEADASIDNIQESIRSLGVMDTAVNYYTYVSTMSESKNLFGIVIPGTSNSFVITGEGKIVAGIDYTEAVVTYDEEAGEITVKLPKAKVLKNGFDNDSWKYFDEKGDTFKPLSSEDFGDSYMDIMKEEETKAIDRGLLTDAERMAQTIVQNVLSENVYVGDSKIVIVFGTK